MSAALYTTIPTASPSSAGRTRWRALVARMRSPSTSASTPPTMPSWCRRRCRADEVKALAEKAYGRLQPTRAQWPARPQEPAHPRRVPRGAEGSARRQCRCGATIWRPATPAAPGEAEALDLLMRIAATARSAGSTRGWCRGEDRLQRGRLVFGNSGLDSGRIGIYAIAAEEVSADEVEGRSTA